MSNSEVVLITNVGHGFGRAIALAYGQDGYHVVCADRDVDFAAKTAAEIEELGGSAIPIQADMTTQLDVRNAFNKVFELYGDLSGVVHVATRESHTPFTELMENEFTELFTENVRSTFLTLKIAEHLVENAWIVLVSPPKSAKEPHMLSIRGAITRMAAAFEADNESLRVNVVVPSRAASDPKHDAQLVKSVQFLGSSEAEGISGHRFYVTLPPPPKFVESLLPEVQAALDENVRQDDLEASLYDDDLVEVDELEQESEQDDSEDDDYAFNNLLSFND
ncbi:MAG: SDR family oxidoreductase [Trueperaceae bacterium]|nr:SDR family oxidoreductase [Trueperaceae bacterium]